MSAVLEAANRIYADALRPAVNDLVAQVNAMRAANDPDGPAIPAIEALERIAKAAKDMGAELRAGVLKSCQESGVTGFEAGGYDVTIKRGSVGAVVTDPNALRAAAPELFVPQPDKIATPELTRRLKAGETLPGAELAETGSAAIQIRGRK